MCIHKSGGRKSYCVTRTTFSKRVIFEESLPTYEQFTANFSHIPLKALYVKHLAYRQKHMALNT
ncbi:MAG: hypothetical protein ACXWM7_04470, partial [Parachlamydiaceae bacterium]